MKNVDKLILPTADKAAIEGEKKMKKKVEDHKRALKMLPDTEKFKHEL